STRRTVNAPGEPEYPVTGTKRTLVAAVSARLLLVETVVAISVQAAPFSHCHLPSVVAFAELPTMTTPAREFALEPPETASVASLNAEANRLLTVLPEGFVVPS